MRARQLLTDNVVKSMNLVHQVVLGVTGGRIGTSVMGMAAVEFHTTGRRSGVRRSVMLTTPVQTPTRTVLVASKGGDDRHPDWYRNLVDDPEVAITQRGVTTPMLARTADAAEKAELWPQIVEAYGGYAGYQRRTKRDIPVVICEPR